MNEDPTTDALLALPDGSTVWYRDVTRSVARRIRFLASYRGRSEPVRCLCRPEGIPLGVVHRAVPTDTFYLYPLHRGDWERHAPGCPLRRPPITGDARPARSPVERLPDGLVLNISLPRYRLIDAPRVEPDETARGELSSLLQILWKEAGLDPSRPTWGTGFRYADRRRRLLEAAARVRLRGGLPIGDCLYIPPLYRPALKEEIGHLLEDFLTRLEPREGRAPYGFFLGALAEIREGRGFGRAIRLAHTYRLLWASEALGRCLPAYRKSGQSPEVRRRIPVLAQTSWEGEGGWLKARDIALFQASGA
ncbi:MAG: DUF1173 family protein [Deferrisomatales bacterium]|nr:DUF1173 family protein [Deferrisomatales bacterium]